jgi:methylenetetrahydrofolate reductase (NADPH)
MKAQNLELSYEFFPPRTEVGKLKLLNTRQELETFNPEFYSVTFGAGGSTRDKTLETVLDIQLNSSISASPHITCVGASNAEIIELLNLYKENGINRLVVLRGDLPSGMVGMGECKFAADLVHLIRDQFGEHFTIAVAAYPEAHPNAKNLLVDIDFFSAKMQAGANMAITQYFYNNDSYFHFMEQCAKKNIRQPIFPGIMPISNFENLTKFSNLCGAEIPRWINKTMAAFEDDLDSQQKLGIDIVTNMIDELIQNGAPGLHFYTMNQSALTRTILKNLNLPQR